MGHPLSKLEFCSSLSHSRTSYCCCLFAKLCLTLCDPLDCSMPGSSVLHYLKFMSIELLMISNHLILCFPLLFLPSSKHPLSTTQDSTHGHHQMANTEIKLSIFAAKDGQALYSQQKQDRELTVAQIMNSLLPNSDLN